MSKKKEQKSVEVQPVNNYPFVDDYEDKSVDWQLSAADIEALKKEHLENLDKIDELTAKKKQSADDFKTQIKQLVIENYKLRAKIKKESETRVVSCRVRYDYEEGTRTVYHPQTNEVIEKRELTNDEKQMEFMK